METLSYAVTEDAITNLATFMSEIFDNHFIRDIEVRRQVCRQLLSDATFIEHVSDRFDLNDALNNGGIFGRSTDPLDVPKPTVAIGCGLTSAQKAVIAQNNLDYNVVFKDSVRVPHNMALAQRTIDFARLKSMINYRLGTAIDFGGNYATHAMSGAMLFHSCTLCEDVEEMHRQVQRDVNLELGEFTEPSKCVDGIQECDVYAQEAISLHTLPRVDPADIPQIFNRHGIEYMTGVHHYDPRMDHATSGFVPDVDMHWEVEDNFVQFFFDNDSSYEYRHRLDWLKQYSHNNYFNDPAYTFLVYFVVDRISNGNVYWTMIRLDKETLGTQTINPQYRYIDEQQYINLQVPEFDVNTGFSISDPRSYVLESIDVPTDMFSFVYKKCMANDKARSDLPLSLDDVRGFAHTYNYVKRVNGTSLTVDCRLHSKTIDKVAKGIYLIVVQRMAHLRNMTSEYSKMFKRIQRRWGNENIAILLTKCFSATAILPFILLTENFNDVLDIVAVHMRSVIRSTKVVAAVNSQLPYNLLSPVQEITKTATMTFSLPAANVTEEADILSDDVDIKQFYEVFKDELKPEMAKIIVDKINSQQQEARDNIEKAMDDSDIPEITGTRESWQEGMDYIASNVDLGVIGQPSVGTDEDILSQVQLRMYEAGLYNYDVALNTIAFGRERCQELWTGDYYRDVALVSKNSTTDGGYRFLHVTHGKVDSGQRATDYMIALDPVTNEVVSMPKDEHSLYIPTNSEYIFVCNAFKIFLGMRMGKNLTQFSRFLQTTHAHVLKLIDGVPGCGKTHEIVSKFTEADLITCAVRETADNTRMRIADKHKNLVKRVRTVDSCVINNVPRAKVVFVDEGLMLLPGTIDYVAQNAKPSVVEVYGDSAQIGFIDRGSKLGILRFEKFQMWKQIEYRDVSVRVPADVCFIMRKFYPEWRQKNIKTCSPIRRSISVEYQPDPDNPTYTASEPGVLMMTITTGDRDKMLSKSGFVYPKNDGVSVEGKTKVLTVHESQGLDVPHATVVRLNVFQIPVFESSAHILVSLTRHTHSLRVLSTYAEDKTLEYAMMAVNATEEELDDCQIETPEWLQNKIEKAKGRGF